MPKVLLPCFLSQVVGPRVLAQLHTVQLTLVSPTHVSVELGNAPEGEGGAATAGLTDAAGTEGAAGEEAACAPGLHGQMRPYPFGGATPAQVAADVPGW
jgi:hypothetical protein